MGSEIPMQLNGEGCICMCVGERMRKREREKERERVYACIHLQGKDKEGIYETKYHF